LGRFRTCRQTIDSGAPLVFLLYMKRSLIIVALWAVAEIALAQTEVKTNLVATSASTNLLASGSVTNLAILEESEQPLFLPGQLDWLEAGSAWRIEEQRSTLGGPLAQPFLSRRPSEIPGRMLHLVNPFAPLDASAAIHRTPAARDLSARSWATVVGWNPGRSAFPDETAHEAGGLLLIKCSKDRPAR
jgi:hypothetical protein